MTYFEFVENVIENFRVSKQIEIVKVEQDLESNELLAVAYEATKSLIIVANYKEQPEIDMPQVQGLASLDIVKTYINLEKAKRGKSSVRFKEADGIASETIFKIDTTSITMKNVAPSLLPDTPKKLADFKPDFEVDLTDEDVSEILKYLSVSLFNPSVFLTKSKKGNLSFKLTDEVNVITYDTAFEVDEGILDEPFKIDLERLLTILKIGNAGVNLAIAEAQNLVRIVKDDEIAEYQYFLIKKAL